MNGSKPWWASVTLWGAIATIAGVVLPEFGVGDKITPADITVVMNSWLDLLNAVLTFGGIIATIVGRFRAVKQVTLMRR